MRNGQSHMETRQVPKIRWTPVRGQVARAFDDVLVVASRSLPERFVNALGPWDLSALEPYQPEFVAGFISESYSVDLDEGFSEARVLMDNIIARDVKFDIGGDRQRIHDISTELSDVTYKHILLPVWVAAYRHRGKAYNFLVNGRTGQVQGERPYSRPKIIMAVIAGDGAVRGSGLALFALWQLSRSFAPDRADRRRPQGTRLPFRPCGVKAQAGAGSRGADTRGLRSEGAGPS